MLWEYPVQYATVIKSHRCYHLAYYITLSCFSVNQLCV